MSLVSIQNELSIHKQKDLEWQLFYENITRSKLFAKIVILFEAILILRNVLLADQLFNIHFIMYVILLGSSTLMLVFILRFEKGDIYDEARCKKYQKCLHILVSIFLLWGAVMTLIDQQSYGHVMAFVVNAMCVSILFYTSKRSFFQIFSVPVIVVIGGLPFFQESQAVMIGHYVNLSVFLFFCWLASKIIYTSYYKIFSDQMLIEESNQKLAEKMEENVRINLQLNEAVEQLKQLSTIDELSQISNRRGFDEYIQKYAGLSNNTQQLSILMMDIDAFKQYNDSYGHVAGDRIIREVAEQIQACINPMTSIAARFGGEEFIIAAFNMPPSEVGRMGEDIRVAVEGLQIPHLSSPVSNVVTISLGVATADITQATDSKLLIEQADQMLYVAKQNGRNRVEISAEKFVCI